MTALRVAVTETSVPLLWMFVSPPSEASSEPSTVPVESADETPTASAIASTNISDFAV